MNNLLRWIGLLGFVTLLICLTRTGSAQNSGDVVWIEGEATTSLNVKPNISGWGHKEFLSGEKWLQVSIEADKTEKELPSEGALLTYAFKTVKPGKYEVWNRIGYEFVRSPFAWRIDSGAWATISPEQLTTDLMELQDWNEVAWLKMGTQTLSPGAHRLEIRLPKVKDDKGKFARVLYASDALCITAAPFTPNSKFKPGASRHDPADAEAAKKVFALPETAVAGQRVSVPLKGTWEICRNDEQTPGETAKPIQDFPSQPVWTGIAVPGDKNELRPDLLMAHRVWYRTRVSVPTSLAGRSFQLVFPQNSLNTTVYVNKVYCGFYKNPFVHFQLDVTRGIKPGINEIWVGIRDAWYGYSAHPKDPMKLRKKFNLPLPWLHQGFQDLAYPIWNASQSGMLAAPELVASGPVLASDVFCKPSVARKEMEVEVTLANRMVKSMSGEVVCQAVNPKTGTVEKTLTSKPFALAAGAEQVVQIADRWENPKLWWPDDPTMYLLRTTVKVAGKPVDVSETPFGFREWSSEGADFKLNGIVWHGWAELPEVQTKEAFLDWYKKTHQTTMRFMGISQQGTNWYGLTPDAALDYMDKNGIVVRRSGILDGEAIGYNAIENDPEFKKLYNSDIKMDLMQNWRDQMVAQVKGERNHPSVQLWSIENEWLFINCINLYGHLMDKFEEEVRKVSEAVRAVDPTRLTMTDGGGANKDNSLPVHGNHYVFGDQGYPRYPALAYEANPTGGGRGRWVWDQKRPRFIGEDYFANGINPFDYSYFGGEETFQGKAQARPAAGLIARMLTEGYRWAGVGAFHFWLGESSAKDAWLSNAPRAVFCRQWDWTFGSEQKVKRTLGIFNDTHSDTPLTLTRTLKINGKQVATESAEYKVAPGTSEKFDVMLELPQVNTRQEGEWTLTLKAGGEEVYRDVKAVSVLPSPTTRDNAVVQSVLQNRPLTPDFGGTPPAPKFGGTTTNIGDRGATERTPNARPLTPDFGGTISSKASLLPQTWGPGGASTVRLAGFAPAGAAKLTAEELQVFDPNGSVRAFLRGSGVAFTPLADLKSLPAAGKVLIVGKDALNTEESASSRLAAYASSGRTVLVLEQKNPLRYQAIPAEIETASNEGRTAFGEDMEHPALRGLQQKDFFTWGPDEVVYRNAYLKPTRGAKSLVQCDNRLQNSALVEVPVGKGLLLLSQLTVGEKLGVNAVAQTLLLNLLDYGAQYKLTYRQVTVALKDSPQLPKILESLGLQYTKVDDPVQALNENGSKIAIIAASPGNLKALTNHLEKVRQFTQNGGWIVFHGLTPDGLSDYNKIVGFDHLIRPFRRERVSFPAKKNPLMAGVTLGDVVMQSSERIFDFTSDKYVASDIFSYIVDYDEVAPFARLPSDYHYNIVNGMVSADAWKYIFSFDLNATPDPQVTFQFPKEQELVEWTWIGNGFYHLVTKVELAFDDGSKLPFTTAPNTSPQTFDISPGHKGKEINLHITDWAKVSTGANVVGIDNVYFKAKRSPEFYKEVRPLLNIGGLMEYVRGSGGIVLNNLLYKDNEEVPENAVKKRTITAAVLRNLQAPFSGGQSVIAGARLQYEPIDISKQANQYRDDKGWFGDKAFTFAALPTGKQTFAGVPFQIYDFPTSPVPTVIMLEGTNVPNKLTPEVRNIPVNRKADALFFLHTARLDARRSDQEIKEKKKYEMLRYVVTYADGQTANIPIYAEIDIENYRQQIPTALPGAQTAWTRRYEGTDSHAVAYMKQWDNPRPGVPIKSLDVVYGDQKRGVPAVLAITAASAP